VRPPIEELSIVPALADIRARLAPYLRPVRARTAAAGRARRRARYMRDGIYGICVELRNAIDCVPILREYGATIGEGTTILGPLHLVSVDRDFANLRVGNNVFIGQDVLMDLVEPVTIGDDCTIVIRTTIVTHFDVGPGPLSATRPRRQGPVVIGNGVFIGAGATVLHGVTIGDRTLIGAHSLVSRDVAADAVVAVPPTRPADTSR
jgi:acetyltransferase-like isoleucine patch superfamily enzyme